MINIDKPYKFILYVIIVSYVVIAVFIEAFPPNTFQYFHQIIGISSGTFALITAIYFIIAALMQVPGGIFLDTLGIKIIVPITMLGTIIGFILYWFAVNNSTIALANFVWGFSLSLGYLIGIYVVTELFVAESLPIFLAILGVCATLGNLSAYTPLEYLINRIGWKNTGYIIISCLILLFILFILIMNKISNNEPSKTKLLLRDELKNSLLLFTNKYALVIFIYSFSTWLIAVSFAGYWLKFYLITFNSMSSSKSLEMVEFYWLSYMLGTMIVGYINKTLKSAKISLIVLSFIAFICYAFLMNPNGLSNQKIMILIFFAGISSSAILLPNFILTQVVDKRYHGVALSVNSAMCLAGAYIGQNLFSFILLDTDLDYYFKILRHARMVSDMYPSLSIFLFFALVAWIASMTFSNQHKTVDNKTE
jgi:predicted MFS family arabinose efflux permease